MTSLDSDPIAEAARQWKSRWGSDAVPAMMAVTSIMRTEQILMARLNALLKPYGLTFPRYEALMILYFSRRGAMPLGKIGALLQVHPTSVTNLIDGLERSRYLRRSRAEDDRRKTLAEITVAGRTAAEKATEVLNSNRFATEPLPKTALTTVTRALGALRAHADGLEGHAHGQTRRGAARQVE